MKLVYGPNHEFLLNSKMIYNGLLPLITKICFSVLSFVFAWGLMNVKKRK